ncbi:MAG: CPXCG motif-containing cysteine-rich protein [Sedimenticola sp.]|jgi:hypothetical protein|nr:MAG: CPXCG motif-containing cysteine-rich protein [Sedimenticola sp.]
MNSLEVREIQCPYCSERIEVVIDRSEMDQNYIEDCQVCCRPIDFAISLDGNGELFVSVSHENE